MNIKIQKILIINIFGIGDVLFTTPLIENLKSFNPNFSIGYLCNRRTESILKRNPKIDNVFVYERDEFAAEAKKSKLSYWKKVNDLVRTIRAEQYDTTIDVSLNGFMGFLSWAAGIPQRIGLNYKNRNIFLNKKIDLKGYEERHVVEYYLDLLRLLEIPVTRRELTLNVNDEDESWADNFLKQHALKEKSLIGLVPGGGASWGKEAIYKRWAPENYAKLADKIIEKFGGQIILMGAVEEQDLCLKVAKSMRQPSISACGQTNITQFAALAHRCKVNIVNDGGPLHIAVAAKAKTVSIFGPVDEKVYGPYDPSSPKVKPAHTVVTKEFACRPCYRQFRRAQCEHLSCLTQITVYDVLKNVEEVLTP